MAASADHSDGRWEVTGAPSALAPTATHWRREPRPTTAAGGRGSARRRRWTRWRGCWRRSPPATNHGPHLNEKLVAKSRRGKQLQLAAAELPSPWAQARGAQAWGACGAQARAPCTRWWHDAHHGALVGEARAGQWVRHRRHGGDLIVTMDDPATSDADLLRPVGTSCPRGPRPCRAAATMPEAIPGQGPGNSCSQLRRPRQPYGTRRGRHQGGQGRPTGRSGPSACALAQLGNELIPALEARGRSERMFGTLQKRLPAGRPVTVRSPADHGDWARGPPLPRGVQGRAARLPQHNRAWPTRPRPSGMAPHVRPMRRFDSARCALMACVSACGMIRAAASARSGQTAPKM